MAQAAARPRVRLISIVRHPIYAILLPVPVVCFLGVLLTDIAYVESDGTLIWLAFSSWLLLAGLVFGAFAAIVLLIDFVRSPGMRRGVGWAHMLFFYLAFLVELLGMFVHQRDGWTAVAGLGIILSIIGAALIVVAAWLHRPSVEAVR
jgi:uncharacterized membrane protein